MFSAYCLGFGDECFGSTRWSCDQGLGVRYQGSGFRDQGSGIRVYCFEGTRSQKKVLVFRVSSKVPVFGVSCNVSVFGVSSFEGTRWTCSASPATPVAPLAVRNAPRG